MIVGLALFLGVHSVRMMAPHWRQALIDVRGEQSFKGLYSIVSLLGLVLLIIGYGQTRIAPQYLWFPPASMSLIAALLMLVAFVLLAATYIPGNRLKGAVGHPMVLGVKVWAVAHLLANGRLGDVVLFSAFLVWAVLNYVKSRKADRLAGVLAVSKDSLAIDAVTVVVGVGAWLVFALWAHRWLIGVSPFAA